MTRWHIGMFLYFLAIFAFIAYDAYTNHVFNF